MILTNEREVIKMTVNEAKLKIATEFIGKYVEWLNDYNNKDMTDKEYGRKYGWGRSLEQMKDTQKSLIWFQSHIFSGRYNYEWKEIGIDYFELYRIGFLSYDNLWGSKARMLGKTDWYYINQKKAKEIYKAYKNGFFESEVI